MQFAPLILAPGETTLGFDLCIPGYWEEEITTDADRWMRYGVPGGGVTLREGHPMVPLYTLRAVVPRETTKILGVRLAGKKEEILEAGGRLLPASPPLPVHEPLSGEPIYRPDPDIYGQDAPFPADEVMEVRLLEWFGHRVAEITIPLAHVRSVSREIRLLKGAQIEVRCAQGPAPMALLTARHLPPALAGQLTGVPQEAPRPLSGASGIRRCSGGGDAAGGCDYLVITTRAMLQSLGGFLEAKSRRLTAGYALLEELIVGYGGVSPEEAISRCLKDASTWGAVPSWVLLAGDHATVPSKRVPANYPNGYYTDIASDHAYTDLNGDFYPSYIIGRLPARTPEELARMCQDLLDYPTKTGAWRRRALMIAGPEQFGYFFHETKDGTAKILEGNGFDIKRCYGPDGFSDLEERLLQGNLFVNYYGHGYPQGWAHALDQSQLGMLSGMQATPTNAVTLSCSTSRHDDGTPCFGEAWLQKGLGPSYIGSSRVTWAIPQQDLSYFQILQEGARTAGEMITAARIFLLSQHRDSHAADNALMLTLFGDPEMDLFHQQDPTQAGGKDKMQSNPEQPASERQILDTDRRCGFCGQRIPKGDAVRSCAGEAGCQEVLHSPRCPTAPSHERRYCKTHLRGAIDAHNHLLKGRIDAASGRTLDNMRELTTLPAIPTRSGNPPMRVCGKRKWTLGPPRELILAGSPSVTRFVYQVIMGIFKTVLIAVVDVVVGPYVENALSSGTLERETTPEDLERFLEAFRSSKVYRKNVRYVVAAKALHGWSGFKSVDLRRRNMHILLQEPGGADGANGWTLARSGLPAGSEELERLFASEGSSDLRHRAVTAWHTELAVTPVMSRLQAMSVTNLDGIPDAIIEEAIQALVASDPGRYHREPDQLVMYRSR
ncbi:MAG: C25 family cysteine peptidase [Pseudomonadota bacterium]